MANDVEIRIKATNTARPEVQGTTKDFDELRKSGVRAGEAVAASTERMADRVAAAKAKLTKANEAEAAALRTVMIASDELDFEKIGGDVDKVAAASRRLDAALRDAARATREVGSASKELTKVEEDFRRAGERAAAEMGRGASSTLTRLGPLLAPAAVVAGGAIAEGIVLGFGAGLIGMGVAATKGLAQVDQRFDETGKHIADRSKVIFQPYGDALLDVAAQTSHTFDQFAPALDRSADRLAPALSRFSGKVSQALLNLEPAIDPMSRATEKVLDSLGNRLPSVTARLERGMHSLADSIEENPEALADLADGAGAAAEGILKLIAALNRAYSPARDSVTWLADLNDKIIELTGQDKEFKWDQGFRDTDQAAQGTSEALDVTRKSAEELAAAQKEAEEAAAEHAKALERLTDAAYDSIGANLSLRDAIDASDDALTDYNEAVRDHGAKSEEASDALRDLEGAAYRVASAARDNALAQQAASGKTRDLVSANQDARAALMDMADHAKGPARAAILAQVAALDILLARLRAVEGTYYANVQVRVSQSGQYSGPPVGAQFSYAHGGVVAATPAAGGGPRGNRVLLGEQGPEVVDLAPGSMVHPAGESRRMLDQAAAGDGGGGFVAGPRDVRFVGDTDSAVASMIMALIKSGQIQIT